MKNKANLDVQLTPLVKSQFVSLSTIEQYVKEQNVLGAMVFDQGPSQQAELDIPHIYMDMFLPEHNPKWLEDKQDQDNVVELWTCKEAVEYHQVGHWQVAQTDNYLFAAMSFDDNGFNIAEQTRNYYVELFELLEKQAYTQMLRIWNFMSRINEDDANGLERYRTFCMGRAEAFEAFFKEVEVRMPSATGIGTQSGKICVAVMAQKGLSDVLHIENPQQTPAYYYPPKYGPKSPSFARATSLYCDKEQTHHVFISGTAAVIGSNTVHHGDIKKQTETTFDNLTKLICLDNMRAYGINKGYQLSDIHSIKVYVRYLKDLPIIKPLCEAAFNPDTELVYLHADVCRDDLDIEIEGVISYPLAQAHDNEALEQQGTLIDHFVHQVHQHPLKTAYINLDENGEVKEQISYTRLHHEVLKTAANLQQQFDDKQAVILALENSTTFIIHYFACIFAGLIAVPIPFNRQEEPQGVAKRIVAIIKNLQLETVVYTHDDSASGLKMAIGQAALQDDSLTQSQVNQLSQMLCLSDSQVIEKDRAFYQFKEGSIQQVTTILYTSGSVAEPKGIPLTHLNLIACTRNNAQSWQYQPDTISVSWMPHSHSFGLVFNILLPLFTGTTCVMMAPEHCMAKPSIWLDVISRYGASHSAGAAFGYDHLLAQIDDQQQDWDLSCWQVGLISAENVRHETYVNFNQQLSRYGLKETVFCPVYGLSESGPVTCKPLSDAPTFEQNAGEIEGYDANITHITSVGKVIGNTVVICVSIDGNQALADGVMGEVCIASDAVIDGYWHLDEQNRETFNQSIAGFEQKFFRTGDLGFIKEQQVYIVGRLKEIVILNGKNYYPIDIEQAIIRELTPGSGIDSGIDSSLEIGLSGARCAAFGVKNPATNIEELHIVHEFNGCNEALSEAQQQQLAGLSAKIAQVLSGQLKVSLTALYWTDTNAIPRTKSGKIQRTKCKVQLLANQLPVQWQYSQRQLKPWQQLNSAEQSSQVQPVALSKEHLRATQAQLDHVLAMALSIESNSAVPWQNLTELAINSVEFITLAKHLSAQFNVKLAAGKLFQLTDKQDLVNYLAEYGHPLHVQQEHRQKEQGSDKPAAPVAATAQVQTQVQAQIAESPTTPVAEKLTAKAATDESDIAIVGMSCYWPKADNPEAFWQNLVDNHDCLQDVFSLTERDLPSRLSHLKQQPQFPTRCGIVEHAELFDHRFFAISAHEAQLMDPQQRKSLELAWQAFEDGGFTTSQLQGSDTAVYWGYHTDDYKELLLSAGINSDAFMNTGLHGAMIANRISYWFDLQGASETINTACSSALVALDRAVKDIHGGDCQQAIVGAINLMLSPRTFDYTFKSNMLNPNGMCASLSDDANGIVRAEGGAAFVLKPLIRAENDGDIIYGVIKGTASCHGGRTSGLTVPSAQGQRKVIETAWQRAGRDIKAANYIELHGTGTRLGDPIEVQTLADLIGQANPQPSAKTRIASVKSNIGHTEAASGFAGLMKSVLQLRHQVEVASLHISKVNTDLPLGDNQLEVAVDNHPWQNSAQKRLYGVSAFGLGGALAHCVVEQYVAPPQLKPNLSAHRKSEKGMATTVLIPLSAKSISALQGYCGKLKSALLSNSGQQLTLEDIAYTLQVGRQSFAHRLVLTVSSKSELVQQLDACALALTADYLDAQISNQGYYQQVTDSNPLLTQLLTTQAGGDFIEQLVADKGYQNLAALWLQGIDIPWQQLYQSSEDSIAVRKVSLPTYCFDQFRHFGVDNGDLVSSKNSVKNSETDKEAQQPPGKLLPATEMPEPSFSSIDTLWQPQALNSAARQRVAQTVLLAYKNQQSQIEGFVAALQANKHFGRVVTIWLDHGPLTGDEVIAQGCSIIAQGCLVIDLCAFAQSLPVTELYPEQHPEKKLRHYFIKLSDIFAKLDAPVGVIAFSHCYTIADAYGAFWQSVATRIKVKLIAIKEWQLELLNASLLAQLADNLSAEIASFEQLTKVQRLAFSHNQVASWQRYHGVWRANKLDTLEPISGQVGLQGSVIDADKAALITGGSRGIGLQIAAHLVDHYQVKLLILLTTSSLPKVEQWQGIIDSNSDTELAQRLSMLSYIKSRGVQLALVVDDLSDSQILTDKLTACVSGLNVNAIGTVIHCAGRLDSEQFNWQAKTDESIARVFAPKVSGLIHLHQALESINNLTAVNRDRATDTTTNNSALDAFIIASSIASTVPKLANGLNDYAVANGFAQHFAEQQATRGKPYLAIVWPNWADTGFKTIPSKDYVALGLQSISKSQGLALFDFALNQLKQVKNQQHNGIFWPCYVNRTFASDELNGVGPFRPLTDNQLSQIKSQVKSQVALEQSTVSQVQPQNEQVNSGWDKAQLVANLQQKFIQTFELPSADPEQDFASLGVDSILLTTIVEVLNDSFDCTFAPSIIVQCETINQLADHLLSEYNLDDAAMVIEQPTEQTRDQNKDQIKDQSNEIAPAPTEVNGVGINRATDDLIAVVGSGCVMANAEDKNQLWQLLSQSEVKFTPLAQRFGRGDYHGALVGDAGFFDCQYFNYTEQDAQISDPQALMLLEQTLAAFCDAGLSKAQIAKSNIGVFVGARSNKAVQMAELLAANNPILGAGQNYLATNISRCFDLHGPSLVIDTACSSALVAMQMAVNQLQAGQIDSAVVAGVNVLINDDNHQMFAKRGILASENEFKLFDANASGEILGEGAAAVILKPLKQALAQGHQIQGVIRAIATNNDGRTAGPASPNPAQQKNVIAKALQQANISAQQVNYVETNGSGKPLGDLVELKTIVAAYQTDKQPNGSLAPRYLGNIKYHVGHQLAAAGMAGFMRNLLILQHQQIPASQLGVTPLEHVDLTGQNWQFNRQAVEFDNNTRFLVAQNAFADGGTNCHVIISNLAAVVADSHYHLDPQLLSLAGSKKPISMPELERKPYGFARNTINKPSLLDNSETVNFNNSSTDSIWSFN